MLLAEYLEPLGLTQTETAARMGVPLNRLNELIRGKRGVTADTALRLAKLLDTDAMSWMNLQNAWDLWHAQRAMQGDQGGGEPTKNLAYGMVHVAYSF
jgi:addiction module HigA family antidote